MPFGSDQALFTLYGRQLAHGAVLYRDLFDMKQPGIFLFYTSAEVLFGFTEVGIHLFELAYWFAFSLFALVAVRPYFTTRCGQPWCRSSLSSRTTFTGSCLISPRSKFSLLSRSSSRGG